MKQDGKSRQEHGARVGEAHVGKPLDGSQYIDVVEEQLYSERRPTRDAREMPTGPEHDNARRQSQVTAPENIPTGN